MSGSPRRGLRRAHRLTMGPVWGSERRWRHGTSWGWAVQGARGHLWDPGPTVWASLQLRSQRGRAAPRLPLTPRWLLGGGHCTAAPLLSRWSLLSMWGPYSVGPCPPGLVPDPLHKGSASTRPPPPADVLWPCTLGRGTLGAALTCLRQAARQWLPRRRVCSGCWEARSGVWLAGGSAVTRLLPPPWDPLSARLLEELSSEGHLDALLPPLSSPLPGQGHALQCPVPVPTARARRALPGPRGTPERKPCLCRAPWAAVGGPVDAAPSPWWGPTGLPGGGISAGASGHRREEVWVEEPWAWVPGSVSCWTTAQ